jgi:hypothetical protein
MIKVKVHLPYVERLSACIAYWQDKDTYVGRRARKTLAALTIKLQSIPYERDPKNEIDSELSKMEEWQNPAHLPQHYQVQLRGAIAQLVRDVNVASFGKRKIFDLKTLFSSLSGCVPDPAPVNQAVRLAERLLYENQSSPHITEIKSRLELITSTYETLHKDIADIQNSVFGASNQPSIDEVETQLQRKFSDAEKAVRDALLMLVERCSLITGLEGETGNIFCSLCEAIEMLDGIDTPAVYNALKEFDSMREQLALSPPDVVYDLWTSLRQKKDQITDMREAVELNKRYAILKILWQNRNDNKVTPQHLLSAYRRHQEPDTLFRIVDDHCWQKLKDAMQIKIPNTLKNDETSAATCISTETVYNPITFAVELNPPDTDIANSFLFTRGLKFYWTIEFGGKKLTPVTSEPTVTQFIPKAVKAASVTVQVFYDKAKDSKPVDPRWFCVKDTNAYTIWQAFTQAEYLGIALSAALAVVTGLSSKYLEPDLVGTLSDYVTLLLWGFAADQARSILQNTIPNRKETK